MRDCYYIHGNPGCGKTTFPKELAKFLRLPYFETNIRTEADLGNDSLEGSDWMRTEAKVGWFAQPLLEPTLENPLETYQNGFLIINDFDRILLDESTGTTALSFFLDYLDPSKKEFYSPYFKCSVNIRYMPIIITGNSDIPAAKKFDALRDRLHIIKFPDLEEKVAEMDVLPHHLAGLLSLYKLDTLRSEQQDVLVKLSMKNVPTHSMRTYKKQLEALLLKIARMGYDQVVEIESRVQSTAPQKLSHTISVGSCKIDKKESRVVDLETCSAGAGSGAGVGRSSSEGHVGVMKDNDSEDDETEAATKLREEGSKLKAIEIAIKLLMEGIPNDIITKYTGLGGEILESLRG